MPARADDPRTPLAKVIPSASEIVAGLTLEERASLGSGESFWRTKSVQGLPVAVLEDGPHGVRHQSGAEDHLGISPSDPATCFPPATALAQTWDPELIERVGVALGVEARAFGVDVLLGPGVNIKRDPRCGRNFEYFSEDPLLSGSIGAAWVRGLQSRGVGASLKHFAANNQEFERMRVSADIDERPLREIYLRSFERVVRASAPWTVMASYNRVNGIASTENSWLLTEVLRDDWGFDGVVVSDWGAVSDRVAAVAAGMDLQMPGGDRESDREVVDAVSDGSLPERHVTESARRVIELAERAAAGRAKFGGGAFDTQSHHQLAREVASRAIVLLKNDGGTLPLPRTGRIAVVGPFAVEPRIQGGGSSRVVPTQVDIVIDELRTSAPQSTIDYAEGYLHDGSRSEERIDQAASLAAASDVAVVFLGLTAAEEAEGTDRPDIEIPAHQMAVLRAVVAAQPRTVAVLVHGGVLRLNEVAALAPAILDTTILGQAGGGAIADVLFGDVNPSGRLGETAPLQLRDAPSFLNYPGDGLHVRYGEGIFVGYRGYDQLGKAVAYPFGHGLSYSTFEYGALQLVATESGVSAAIDVVNTSSIDGREVVQFYVGGSTGVTRPVRELRAFRSVAIPAGATTRVEVEIPRGEFAYWDIREHGWRVEAGQYVIEAGASSRDLRASAQIELDGDPRLAPFTGISTIGELMEHPVAADRIKAVLVASGAGQTSVASKELGIDAHKSTLRIPLNRVRGLSAGRVLGREQLGELLAAVNEES
ncbi:glycoside hydrolase family 3 C-terminal domain-containing protein [Leifsonia sp. Root4]|uniref:glycoside hydrolase family 3 C-terminal domain-containing protein n=1 Tax=Leifsonia sp. Root4 TaxID=1736525 RepID=UPI0009EBDBBB|nr:glycoside hydrolase family 3 C-terminal domain-containing protein [Leifsonia sp. Root4]